MSGRRVIRSAGNPIDEQKGADKEREHAVQRITCRVGMSVHSPKHGKAEQTRQQAHNRAGNRSWDIEPTETLKPFCFHMCYDEYGAYFVLQSDFSQGIL